MEMVTQNAYHRQRMLEYFYTHGGTKTAIRYKASRKTVYRWADRYDGTLESLKDESHRPKSHPHQHTEEELTLIRGHIRRNGRVVHRSEGVEIPDAVNMGRNIIPVVNKSRFLDHPG